MSGDQFDRWMRQWLDREAETAPPIQPPAFLEQRVRHRADRPGPGMPRRIEWTATVLAGAALILLVIHLPGYLWVPTSPDAAIRELVGSRATLPEGPLPGGKGRSKKGGGFFRLLLVQQRSPDFPGIEQRDVRQPDAPPLKLGERDNYRLLVQTQRDLYLTVFQVAGRDRMARLFPAPWISLRGNPIRAGDPVELPTEPRWLYVKPDSTPGSLIVVASEQPSPELDRLYTDYLRDSHPPARRMAIEHLLTFLESWSQSASGHRQVYRLPIESKNP